MCASVFVQDNITTASGNSTASVAVEIESIRSILDVRGQACMAHLDFIACIATVVPCDGFAWCGSMSRVELNRTITSACVCERSSCSNTSNAMNDLSSIILNNLTYYYNGSSTTGLVDSNSLVCQDVTVGKTCTCMYL